MGDCLEYTGARSKNGYGVIWVDGKWLGAHRLAWALANNKPVPNGKHILHSCDNPPCCEPGHLRPGTRSQNMVDMVARGRCGINCQSTKTLCPQGHPYDEANTYVNPRGARLCRACARSAQAAYRRRH
jgi:hypothetical protein